MQWSKISTLPTEDGEYLVHFANSKHYDVSMFTTDGKTSKFVGLHHCGATFFHYDRINERFSPSYNIEHWAPIIPPEGDTT